MYAYDHNDLCVLWNTGISKVLSMNLSTNQRRTYHYVRLWHSNEPPAKAICKIRNSITAGVRTQIHDHQLPCIRRSCDEGSGEENHVTGPRDSGLTIYRINPNELLTAILL